MVLFEDLLIINGLDKDKYLKEVKRKAYIYGLNKNLLEFSNNPKYKLEYYDKDNNKYIYFGSNGYNDYIIYKMLERLKEIQKGEADIKRHLYLSRSSKIKGNWKHNKLSKNNLSINILW